MKFADLHCDTLFELYNKNQTIRSNKLHISLDKTAFLEQYIQVAAVWSNKSLSDDECYTEFFKVLDNFKKQVGNSIYLTGDWLKKTKWVFIPAIEDARLLNNDINRLYVLKEAGVKFITLVWRDDTCIGGAWNTEKGLTDFGIECVNKMLEFGIIPDVSHGSRQLIRDVSRISEKVGKPFCATHSNSFSVCEHKRNLTDDDALLIVNSGGIIGLSLYPPHLSVKHNADIDDILKHIDHYLNLVGDNCIAFGCDFDGVDNLPEGINDISSVEKIYTVLRREFGVETADKIIYNNVYNFLIRNA